VRRHKARIHAHQYNGELALAEFNRALELDPQDAASLVDRAYLLFEIGKFTECIADLDKAIALVPDDGHAYLRRGHAKNARGRPREALADFEKAVELTPDQVEPYRALYVARRRAGADAEARAELDRLERVAGGWSDAVARAEAQRALAEGYLDLGEPARALALADGALGIDPSNWRPRLVKATGRRLLGDESGFRQECDAITRVQIAEPHDMVEFAWAVVEVCDLPDRALAELARALEFDPDYHAAYEARQWINRRTGRLRESLPDLKRLIERGVPWALYDRGEVYLRLREFDKALADTDRVIAMMPEAWWVYSQRATLRAILGNPVEARKDFDRSVELSTAALHSRAEARLLEAQLPAALADLDNAIQAGPANPGDYLTRAYFTTYGASPCAAAAADLRRAREIAPPQSWRPDSLVALSRLHVLGLHQACPEANDPQESLAAARKALALAPDRGRPQWMLGAALYRNGRFEEALSAVRAALPSEGGIDPVPLYFAAMASQRLGRPRDARRYYEQGLEVNTDFPLGLEAKRFREEAEQVLGLPPARMTARAGRS
jgi:tetratricopeptide (TPR) repeat protein